jgi:hypothetical protein
MFALVKNETVTNPLDGSTSEVEVIKLFPPYSLFEDKDGTQHSAETLQQWSFEERVAHGIYSVAYEDRPDERFYTITENNPQLDSELNIVKVTFTGTAKELEDSGEGELKSLGLKSIVINQAKEYANLVLSRTDWMLVRKIERDIDVPAETSAFRASVIAESNRLQAAVSAATDITGLIAAVDSVSWPVAE